MFSSMNVRRDRENTIGCVGVRDLEDVSALGLGPIELSYRASGTFSGIIYIHICFHELGFYTRTAERIRVQSRGLCETTSESSVGSKPSIR